MNTIYRVILSVGYFEAFFDFDSPKEATEFAATALATSVQNEDAKRPLEVVLRFINKDSEESEG